MAKRWATRAVGVVGLVALSGSAVVSADEQALFSRVRVPMGPSQPAVHQAIREAEVLFEEPECQRVLEDFRDQAGRPLLENLTALGRRPSQFVTDIWFIDASTELSCKSNPIMAYTSPKSRIVYLCSDRFRNLAGNFGAVVIIHELLHALGLGEGGAHPNAMEITRQVFKRCGE
jgi:hypothetical protein